MIHIYITPIHHQTIIHATRHLLFWKSLPLMYSSSLFIFWQFSWQPIVTMTISYIYQHLFKSFSYPARKSNTQQQRNTSIFHRAKRQCLTYQQLRWFDVIICEVWLAGKRTFARRQAEKLVHTLCIDRFLSPPNRLAKSIALTKSQLQHNILQSHKEILAFPSGESVLQALVCTSQVIFTSPWRI